MKNLNEKLSSKYQLQEEIGKGGMGVVYKARDLQLDRIVAIKVLLPEAVGDETARKRFLREARAAAKLNHQNIATIYAIEEVDNIIYISMEYVAGQTLANLIANRRLSIDEILGISLQILEALQAAHEMNVIHRDVKPDNILISGSGQVKIMDFGLAKIRGEARLTKDEFSLGTIDYVSPEQISRDMEVDARSDLFSFGVLLYEMLTGELPFNGEHEWAVLYAILNTEPKPFEKNGNQIPPLLEELTFKCLRKSPLQRYQSAGEAIAQLRGLKKESSPKFTPIQVSRKTKNKYFFPVVALAVLLVIISLGFSFFYFNTPRQFNNRGVRMMLDGDWAKAKKTLQRAIKKDSAYSSAWGNLALAYFYQTQYDSAVFCARTAIEADAANLSACYILARAYEQLGEFQKAIDIYFQAITADSSAIQAYNDVAYLLLHLGRTKEAIHTLQRGLKQQPDSPKHAFTYKNLGKAYLLEHNFEQAISSLSKSVVLDSTLAEAQTLLSNAQDEMQKLHNQQKDEFAGK